MIIRSSFHSQVLFGTTPTRPERRERFNTTYSILAVAKDPGRRPRPLAFLALPVPVAAKDPGWRPRPLACLALPVPAIAKDPGRRPRPLACLALPVLATAKDPGRRPRPLAYLAVLVPAMPRILVGDLAHWPVLHYLY